ncbi:hypothetical protein [Nitrospira sp. Ecomares 2.1]
MRDALWHITSDTRPQITVFRLDTGVFLWHGPLKSDANKGKYPEGQFDLLLAFAPVA